MNPRRLTRSRDRQLAGVAGGMAEYLDIDPTVIRILWIIVILASGGLALLAYLILALVMPQASYAAAPGGWAPTASGAAAGSTAWGTPPAAPAPIGGWDAGATAPPQVQPRAERRGIGAAAIVGVVLIVFGAIALADAALPGWVAGAIMGPAVILALGAALLASSLRRRSDEAAPAATPAVAPAPAPAPAWAPTPAPAYTPAPTPDTMATAAPWDATDTQSVGSEDFAQAPGAVSDQAADGGSRPA